MEMSGFIGLLVAIVTTRIINERAYAGLSTEEKVRLMDGFSKSRKYSLIPLVILIGLFYFLSTKTSIGQAVLLPGYLVILIVYIIANAIFNQRKLRSLDMPPAYRRSFTFAQAISMSGVAWLFFTMLFKHQP